jgi:hypothetical protein
LFEQITKANKFAPVARVVGTIKENKFTKIFQAVSEENFN